MDMTYPYRETGADDPASAGVGGLLGEASKGLAEMAEYVERLESRLGPVLEPPRPAEAVMPAVKRGPEAPLVEQTRALVEEAHRLTRRLSDIHARVRL